MASVNKVIIVGNLGRDPEMRTFPSGDQVANVTVATTDKWKDKQTGEMKEATEWHRITFNGRLAEIAGQYLRKGSQVYVEGSLRTRKWTDQSGAARKSTAPRSAPTVCRCWASGRTGAAREAGTRRLQHRPGATRRRLHLSAWLQRQRPGRALGLTIWTMTSRSSVNSRGLFSARIGALSRQRCSDQT